MSVEVMDEEWLYSEEQVRSLLDRVREQAGAHRSVHPFMRMVAEQALRPSEARALRVTDVVLLERDLGKLTARHKGMVREIPLQPQVVVFLRGWISEADLQDADLLFPGTRGEEPPFGFRMSAGVAADPRGRPAKGRALLVASGGAHLRPP
ncbi:tyrosine-type recombinase/integrase [Streptomyces pristinaespiralis]|uniref:tyrosine-type recombinase/integrase n=1 Tax=Streptomyces pristinaespiralis TaxID=38300 RepID=UPI0038359852